MKFINCSNVASTIYLSISCSAADDRLTYRGVAKADCGTLISGDYLRSLQRSLVTRLLYDDRRSRAVLTSRRSGGCCCCWEQRLMKLVMFYFGENIPVQFIARIFSFGYHTWTSCTLFTANSLKYRVRPVAYSTPHQLHGSRIDLLSLWNTHISSHLPKTTDMTNKTSSRLTL